MPSRTHSGSSSSAAALYLDKEARIAALGARVRDAARRCPEIRRVLLFGSLAVGIPTPRSDADLLVEVASSPHARPRDRVAEVLRLLDPLPCAVDLFVYTSEELEELRRQGSPLVRTALRDGIDLV